MKKIFLNKAFLIGMTFLMLFFWLFFAVLTINKIGFSVLTYTHGSFISSDGYEKIIKNHTITEEFIAKDNNLGLIILKFKDYNKPEFEQEDTLLFQLRYKDSGDLIYSNKYRSGYINDRNELIIGFPKISNSRGEEFKFTISSLNGNEKNSTNLDKSTFFSGYQYLKPDIVSSFYNISSFAGKKLLFNFSDFNFILASTIYLIPFIIFLLTYFYLNKNKQLKKYLWVFTAAFIIIQVFLIQRSYLGLEIIVLILWILSLAVYGIKSSVNFYLAFILIVLWLILFYLGINEFSEKINILAYLFLGVGTIQLIMENVKK